MQTHLLAQEFQKSHIAESWKDVCLVTVTLNACYFLYCLLLVTANGQTTRTFGLTRSVSDCIHRIFTFYSK